MDNTGFRRLIAALLMLLLAVPAMAQGRQALTERGYVLGPNDSISVIVYGQQEFNVATRVKPDGTVVLPLVGKVMASGRTVVTLADDINKKLVGANFLKDPIVNVELTAPASRWVRISGKVGQPGLVQLDRNYTLLDALLRVGWIQESGATYVQVRRGADGREQTIQVADLARGNPETDILLEAGDTIFVPDADLVYLTGQVNRPGAFALKPGMTVRQLLAMAGGVTATGSANKVGLTRGNARETDADQSTLLQKNDVIIVKERLF
ncbi:SLBB domain-containing protein [Sandaracinobacteroides saxicola]|uniref:SLBB domain-containing protein n=1 Tax=Sandaracinobacteroides saxicola TaxID=2759707 RepID=A0A7G5IFC2_9SPHN|nr:polysaccharide biosynthesis/export family protein [Sandaracinobacteroides saxicola]QMW22064.1 SLBB domain-containing protein [Sandaracinobacteroides saxicola]